METRAHHILIGAFTIIVVAGAMLFALWLAKSSMARQYDYYDIVFTEAVTGLSPGGMVQYNGIRVGEVAQLKLDPQNPSKVLVRIRVDGGTPVKVDTRAKLGLAGLTGVSFIQLTGGSPGAAALKDPRAQSIPRIQADDSALSRLLAGSEDLVGKVNEIITRANELLSGRNVVRIGQILDNLEETTGAIADEREDVRTMIRQLAAASGTLKESLAESRQLIETGNRLLGEQGPEVMAHAAEAMQAISHAAGEIDSLLSSNRAALESGAGSLGELGPAIRELRRTLHSLQGISRRIEDDPTGFLFGSDQPREFNPQ